MRYKQIVGPNGPMVVPEQEAPAMSNPFIGKSPDPSPPNVVANLEAFISTLAPDQRQFMAKYLEAISSAPAAIEPAKSSISALGSSIAGVLADTALEGVKLVGAHKALGMAREALLLTAESMASRGFLAKLPLIGKRIQGRRMAEIMASPGYLTLEFLGTAGAGALLKSVPGIPKSLTTAIDGAQRRLMTIQATQLASKVSSPIVQKLFQVFSAIPKLLASASVAEGQEGK